MPVIMGITWITLMCAFSDMFGRNECPFELFLKFSSNPIECVPQICWMNTQINSLKLVIDVAYDKMPCSNLPNIDVNTFLQENC